MIRKERQKVNNKLAYASIRRGWAEYMTVFPKLNRGMVIKGRIKGREISEKAVRNDQALFSGKIVLNLFLMEMVPNAKMAPEESIIQS